MFIKKDLRKIPEILEDTNDDRSDLFLARRSPEFKGTLSILVDETSISKFEKTKYLSLNANMLNNIDGIGAFSQSPLSFLSLSNNKIDHLSEEMRYLTSLQTLIIEDNLLSSFPVQLETLYNLKSLHLTGNPIGEIPQFIEKLVELEELAVDNCNIHTVSMGLSKLIHLKKLLLGNNSIQNLPTFEYFKELTFLCINSNQLTHFPTGIPELPVLTTIYANNNQIEDIEDSWSSNETVTYLNLEHNEITNLPPSVEQKWFENGIEKNGFSLQHNPIIDILNNQSKHSEDDDINEIDTDGHNVKRQKHE